MKQICGYCLEEISNGKHCPCNPIVKRTFYSEENNFTLNKIDEPICECGCRDFQFKAHTKAGKRQILAFECTSCNKFLGAETYFVHGNPKGVDYIDVLEEEQNERRD